MQMKSAYFLWVIRTRKKHELFNRRPQYWYWAQRTSLKNSRYLTPWHNSVKLFGTKDEAEIYLQQKAKIHDPVDGVICRRKIFVNRKGYYDYWKNREVFLK